MKILYSQINLLDHTRHAVFSQEHPAAAHLTLQIVGRVFHRELRSDVAQINRAHSRLSQCDELIGAGHEAGELKEQLEQGQPFRGIVVPVRVGGIERWWSPDRMWLIAGAPDWPPASPCGGWSALSDRTPK